MEAVYTTDESKRRFEILARQVFIRFKALIMEPAAFAYAERHDNIEAIYKKLMERRDTADVTELLKELHRIVNEAIRTAAPGDDQMDSRYFDLSQIDLEKLRDEFAKKCKRKATALEDIRQVVENKLAQMLAINPSGWTTTSGTPTSSPTTTARKTVSRSRKHLRGWSIWPTVSTLNSPCGGRGPQRGRIGALRPAKKGSAVES